MPVEGAIAERARSILPITWDALSRDKRYGDQLLQTRLDLVKEHIFGEVIDTDAEEVWPLKVLDFCAKLVALEIIPAGIDLWMSKSITVTTTGTSESEAWVDRAKQLESLRDDLLRQTRILEPEILPVVPVPRTSLRRVPLLSSMDDDFLTPHPQEFPRPYLPTART